MELKSKEEFELYALMYVAGLDLRISKEEAKNLHQNVTAEMFEYVSEMFQKDSDAESIETIKEGSETFLTTDTQKQGFIKKLRLLSNVDAVSHIEEANISLLEKIILDV